MSHNINRQYQEWFEEQVDKLDTLEEVHNFLEDEIHRTKGEVLPECEEYAQEKMDEFCDLCGGEGVVTGHEHDPDSHQNIPVDRDCLCVLQAKAEEKAVAQEDDYQQSK